MFTIDDEPTDNEPLDDEENVMRHRRPLDLSLALDGGMDDAGDADDDENAPGFAQDGAGDGDGAQDDAEDHQPPQPRTAPPEEMWYLMRAERDADGEWRTVVASRYPTRISPTSTSPSWPRTA